MEPFTVRGVEFNNEKMVLCGTISGREEEELLLEAKKLLNQGAEMLEWRADVFLERFQKDRAPEELKQLSLEVAGKLRTLVKEVPLLVTLRRKEEGGYFSGDAETYCGIVSSLAEGKIPDLIDVEASIGEYEREKLIEYIHGKDILVITSCHIIQRGMENDLPRQEIRKAVDALEHSKGDILKLACTVETLEEAGDFSAMMKSEKGIWSRKPHVLIAMGEAGVQSRYDRKWGGSCMTFGAGTNAVAPGQLAMAELKKMCYTFTE